jgi:hypothetical protein
MENVQAMLIPVRQLLLQPCYSYIMHNAFSSTPVPHFRSINMSLNTPTPLYSTISTEDFHHIVVALISFWLVRSCGDRPILWRVVGLKRPRGRRSVLFRQRTAIAHQDDQQAPPEDYSLTNASLVYNP